MMIMMIMIMTTTTIAIATKIEDSDEDSDEDDDDSNNDGNFGRRCECIVAIEFVVTSNEIFEILPVSCPINYITVLVCTVPVWNS